MSEFEAMVNAHLGVAQRKQANIDQQAKNKQDYLDPVFEFGADEVSIVDADTVDLPNGQRLRLTAGEGRTLDSYEKNLQTYIDRPEKFESHRRSYAKAYGLDPEDVTIEDLTIAGESQARKFKERLSSMADENGRIRYRNRGTDEDNRVLAELDPTQVNLSGREDNARYDTRYNYEQRLSDAISGETGDQAFGRGDRSLRTAAGDQVVNFVGGAGNMANDLLQGAGALVGVNNIPGVDEGHGFARDKIEQFKEKFNSPQQQRRERLERERNELQSEFFNVQRDKYIKDGNSDVNASIRAGIDEFSNAVGNMIDNPGAILDKTVESLPYMLSVAAAGRKATQVATSNLQKQVMAMKGTGRGLQGPLTKEVTELAAKARTKAFLDSPAGQKYLKRYATVTGISTVGITEGLSTSAEVYDSIVNMSEAQASNSDKYLEMREEGYSHDKAVNELAESAHLQTLLTVTLAAGAASAITGAGAFEGQLFTGLRTARKAVADTAKKAAAEPTKKGVIKSAVVGSAKLTGKAAAFLGPAAAKEGAEELLQSGGGEFLSQLASFDATGEQVGPGVGRAAGEGFVVGAASGAGAQATLGSLRAVLTADPNKFLKAHASFKDKDKPQPVNAVPKTATVNAKGKPVTPPPTPVEPGGSIESTAVQTVASPSDAFEAVAEAFSSPNPVRPRVTSFLMMRQARDAANAAGTSLNEKQEQFYQVVKERAEADVAAAADTVLAKKPEDRTPEDMDILFRAGDMKISLSTENMSDRERKIYEGTVKLAESLDTVAELREEQVERASSDGQKRTIRQVWNNKFGDIQKGANARPGLGYYNRRMREIMARSDFTTENEELNSLMSGLRNFTGSQNRYLENARLAVRQRRSIGNFKYSDPLPENSGGSQALLEILEREQIEFNKIRDGLVTRYEDWKGAAEPVITNAASGASQRAPEASTTATQTSQSESNQTAPKQTALERRLTSLDKERAELEARLEDETLTGQEKNILRQALRKVVRQFDKLSKRAANTRDETERNKQAKKDEAVPVNPAFLEGFAAIQNNKELSDRERQLALVKLRRQYDERGDTALGRRIGNIVNKLAKKLSTPRPKFAEGFNSGGFKPTSSGISGLVDSQEENEDAPASAPTAPAVATRTLRSAAQEGSHSVLAFLKERSSDKAIAALAGRVLEVLGDRDVQIVELTGDEMLAKFGNARAKGAYHNGVIYLNKTALNSVGRYRNTLLHEAIHAAINGHIEKGISPELKNRLYDLNLQVIAALRKSDHPHAQQMAAILSRKEGPEELLTHGLTTPFLQEFLRGIQIGEQTLWDKFVQFVADLLNIPDKSALGEVLAITESIFEEISPTQSTVSEASANSEPVDGAPRATAGGEQAADANTGPSLAEQAAARDKAVRLSEAKRARTLLQNERLWPNQIYLSNTEDATLYKRLRESGVTAVQAIEQVLAQIEPNPEARNTTVEPAVPLEEIEKAATDGALLNSQENQRTVAARSIPETLRDLASGLEAHVLSITKALNARKLGTKLTEVFERRSGKVQDLLASSNFIMDILTDPAAREIFYEKVGTTLEEESALNAFAEFYTAFAQELDQNMQRLPNSPDAIGNLVEVNPLYYWQDDNGKLDRNLVASMALEGMQWLIGTGSQSTWNSPEAIRALLGLDDNAPITAQMWRAVGRGRTRTSVVQEIGNKVAAHLNMRPKNDTRPKIDQVLIAALGAQTLTTLKSLKVFTLDGGKNVEMPLIYQHGVSRAEWNTMAEKALESQTATDKSEILFISNSVGQVWDAERARWVRRDITTDWRKRVDDGRKIFNKLFGSTNAIRAPQFEKPTMEDIPKKITRSSANVPKAMRERQLHDAQKEFRAETEVIDLVDKFSSPQRFLELAHAYLTEAELEQLHELNRPGAAGRNDGLMRDLMAAIDWSRQHGRRGFYLTTRQTQSGRFIYDSNVISPQANKLHRFMFIREGWTRHIKKRDPATMTAVQREQYQAMMMAIGLSMKIKTEYTAIAEVTRQVEEAFTKDGDWKAAMDALLSAGERFTPEQEAALGRVLSKNGTHTLAGLVAASKWFGAKEGDQVAMSLPHETDGVTNGYIIGLLQTPPSGGITPAYRELLNAGGIYFDDDPWKNLAEYKADGNLDNYEYIAKDTRSNLVAQFQNSQRVDPKVLKEMIADKDRRKDARNILVNQEIAYLTRSGLVPNPNELYQEVPNDEFDVSVGRKWAKDPLMVMSYGAGVASIIRAVIGAATEKFYEMLAKSNAELDQMIAEATTPARKAELEATRAQVIADGLNRAYSIINMVARANQQARISKNLGIDPETGDTIWGSWKQMGTTRADGVITAEDVLRLAEAYKGDVSRVAKEFVLSKDAEKLFHTGLEVTYGKALTDALLARLQPVMAIRARMNAANQLANMLYVEEYNNQVRTREAQGEILTPAAKRAIQEDLALQGLAPSLEMVESENQTDRLMMTATAAEYLRSGSKLLGGWGVLENARQLTDIVYGVNNQERIPAPAKTLTGRITTQVPDINVGVSAVVKSIHALDGVINSLLWGQGPYSVLNVHDAQVSPWWAAADIATAGNAGFIETLAGYDLPLKFIDMAFPIIRSLYADEDKRLTQEQKDRIAIQMGLVNEAFPFTINRAPPDALTPLAVGRWTIWELGRNMLVDQQGSIASKEELFGSIRYVNQFAQADTMAAYPQGVTVQLAPEYTSPEQRAQSRELAAPVPLLTSPSEVIDLDTKFSEDFQNQLESEKIVTAWEGLAQYETGTVNPGHTTHLREIIKNLVAPALQTMDPIFQQIMEGEGIDANTAEWQGDLLRLKTAGHTLTSNVDVSLQERAAQEYVTAVVHHSVETDHFVRKEVRRLFEQVAAVATPSMFLPAEIVGDPGLAYELAENRYNYIFNSTEPNEAYERFLSIGLTNEHFARALTQLNNTEGEFVTAPDWSKGFLRGMFSLFRQMVQRLSGTSLRYEGGTISDAVRALAQSTIAVNRRNMQRMKDLQNGADTTSRVQRVNQRLVNAINDRFVEPLAKGLESVNRKRLDPKNPTLPGFLKSATYVALKSRDDEVRDEYNRFYRELTSPYNVGKDNAFFETLAEVTPWDEQNLDWIGLLQKSKYMVDMARQEASDHTRTFIDSSFDKNNYMSTAHKMAITNTVLKTDLSALLQDEDKVTDITRLAELLKDPNARKAEIGRLESIMRALVAKEGQAPNLFFLFQNQARSLANFMVRGETTVENGMLNAHNIARQYMLYNVDRKVLKDLPAIENVIDRLTSIYALDMQSFNDLRLTNDIMQHEMQRQDVGDDNGFTRLVGMHINFKELAKQNLFKGIPTQMVKGYVYEIFDGDVNVEYVAEGSPREEEVLAEGMVLVGELPKDSHDDYKGKRLLYKGMKGLNTYNKSIVSLTDLQHRGANLFSTNGYQSQTTLGNLNRTRRNSYITAKRQFNEGFTKPGANMVPVLNNVGEIVDYRYMMTESNKRKILKKEDPFDRVLPRMFASITDRNQSETINKDVIRLAKDEWSKLRNNPAERFLKISRTSPDEASRDMWNLLPESMQREAKAVFGFEGMYVRDNVANLVLGFRKMTVTNIKGEGGKGTLWGQGTPVVRMAEKIWQEIVQLMRIKIAILTPAVVLGNIASNTAMLLTEGIPVNFIRKQSAEAISAMRQYQKDRQKATELMRQIGAHQALGRNTRALEVHLARLNADMNANPVADLVRDGLFTSITADLGVDDDTLRGSLIRKAEDAIGNSGGQLGRAAAFAVKEAYMLPGSKGFQAAIAATQYGDFVGRYVKFKYDTQVNKKDRATAIREALAAFIYYDIPQPKYLQMLNDTGLVMFTKFFLRIQPIIARMYTQNPVSAFSIFALQKSLLPAPFSENIANYGMGDGLTNKWNNPLNLPGKAWDTLNPTEPALLQWILNPFGL